MVRILLVAIVLFFGNCTYRTEYGRKRMLANFKKSEFTLLSAPIDTGCLYFVIEAYSITDRKPLESLNKSYLKFYAKGRVGTFYNYDRNNINSLNPERADMGYYYKKGSIWVLKTFFEHPQGGGWVKEQVRPSNGDTLVLQAEDIETKYIRIKLSKEFLIYSPDW